MNLYNYEHEWVVIFSDLLVLDVLWWRYQIKIFPIKIQSGCWGRIYFDRFSAQKHVRAPMVQMMQTHAVPGDVGHGTCVISCPRSGEISGWSLESCKSFWSCCLWPLPWSLSLLIPLCQHRVHAMCMCLIACTERVYKIRSQPVPNAACTCTVLLGV